MRDTIASRAVAALILAFVTAPLAPAAGQEPSSGASPASALEHYRLQRAPAWRFGLPLALAEISGVAFTDDGRLLAHGDEAAVIWRLDLQRQRAAVRFAFGGGGRAIRGDFEDIVVMGQRIFLLTSAGAVLEGREAPQGHVSPVLRQSRGLRGVCEVEGMTWDPATRSLLLLCKEVRAKRWRGQVVILALSPDSGELESEPRALISEKELQRVTGAKRFNGSALARHPRTGTFLLLAGPQRLYAEVTGDGAVLGGGRLDPSLHRQPEGLAIGPDLTLVISDEAAGGEPTVTGYAFVP
ncbi:MAG: hypothetical protein H0T44_05205 [Gemmatimonadales bacterium]|nr:hypothetical protein [Gemmatimonadales bacterium]MDQ3426441.1 hypothetical protein [Gemmatimonadota bacterium]